MSDNGARPELDGASEIALRCRRQLAGIVERDADGIPVAFRRRCKDALCCPPRPGFVAVHVWTIYGARNGKGVGEYATRYERTRPVEDLAAEIERRRAG